MALPVALPVTAWGGLTILHCCHVGPCNTAGVDRPARHEGHRPFGQAPTCQCEGQRSDTMPRMRWTVSLGVFLVWVQFVAAGEPLPPPCDGHCPAKCHCRTCLFPLARLLRATPPLLRQRLGRLLPGKGPLGCGLVQGRHPDVMFMFLCSPCDSRQPRHAPGWSSSARRRRLWLPGRGNSHSCRPAVTASGKP